MQPAAQCQEPRGFWKRGCAEVEGTFSHNSCCPHTSKEYKETSGVTYMLQTAISSSLSLFANTELQKHESYTYVTKRCLSMCPLGGVSGPAGHRTAYSYQQP